MRLGVLSRSIIVASCVWMVGGTYYFAKTRDDAAWKAANDFYNECTNRSVAMADCLRFKDNIYASHTTNLQFGLWGFSAFQAGVYLAMALIVFGIVVGSIRWILAGRKTAA